MRWSASPVMNTFTEKMRMNIKVLQWLLKNQAVLLKVVEVAKGWKKDALYADQWAIVDAIARLVIPLLEQEKVSPKALASTFDYYMDSDGNVVTGSEPYPQAVFAAGYQTAALNIDWKLLIDVVLPLVISILQALAAKEKA